ncbi:MULTISPECIES: DUF2510 domain-containing protein [Microbacterium]|uniref:DUF2510 domain-containing protein n=1 Tax=Microbacterium TaxID=33882 RepID=UPI00217EC3EB|nr:MULTISPECIES: DUF2510 domain-containing protein [Microbacterium]UWF76875.1 DUF2510 domain-containing protein [Microbacterium neungamense]WCM55031.1 DUF2510 domain-containing protein [Microbacterium sp. EF45047]
MSVPAGWYDDGSGRQRWWDGTQWTEHFAPEQPQTQEAQTPQAQPASESAEAAASAESAESAESAGAAQSAQSAPGTESDQAASGPHAEPDAEDASPAPGRDDVVPPPTEIPAETTAFPAPGASPAYAPPASGGYAAPGYTAPPAPGAGVPPYAGPAAPGYPGAAPGGQPPYAAPGGQPPYGAAPGYGAPAYATATAPGPQKQPIVGYVGLGLAVVGTILACIFITFGLGVFVLFAAFVVSIVALFLKNTRKWPAITGLVLSIVGGIAGTILFLVIVISTASQLEDFADGLPSAPPIDEPAETGEGSAPVEEGALGEPVAVVQMDGTAEVTIRSATWGVDNGSDIGIDAVNGGYLILDVLWEGVEGTTNANPLYFSVLDAEGNEGDFDFMVDGALPGDSVQSGDQVEGLVSFDVAESPSYTVIITDELLQEVARVDVTATAR